MAHDSHFESLHWLLFLFGKECQSLILCAIKLCWYLFVLDLTMELPSALSPFNYIGWKFIAYRWETTLNIIVSHAIFLLFSSFSEFSWQFQKWYYIRFEQNAPLVSAYSQCPSSVFKCVDPMGNIHIQSEAVLKQDRLSL